MAMPPAPHSLARVMTTVITSAVWWLILYGAGYAFCGGSKVAHVAPAVMANITVLSYVFIPYFVTQSVLISMLDGVLKQRIIVPDAPADPNGRIDNPWRSGVINAVRFGLAPAAIGYVLAIRASADTVAPGAFASRFATGGMLMAAVVAWLVAGKPFLQAARVPRERRMFQGDPQQYLATRYAWPHGIANAIINGALAIALSPVSIADAGALVPAPNVVVDAVITFFILTWLMVAGAKTQARVEAQWGIAPESAATDIALPTAFLPAFFAGLGFATLVGIAFWLLGAHGMSVYSWVLFRGVVFGVYTAWVAKRVARAMLNETFHPEAAATAAPTGA
jgi:hypothetical protein